MGQDLISGIEKLKQRKQNAIINQVIAKREMAKVPIEKFDEFVPGNFMGANPKKFVRCMGYYLMDMFNEIRSNPQSSYVTCVNRLIEDKTTTEDGFTRTSVSCILKEFEGKNSVKCASNELICSRLADLFNVKTNYVAPIKHNHNKVLIVDFLSGDDELESFRDIVGKKVSFYKYGKNSAPIIAGLVELNRSLQNRFEKFQDCDQKIFNIQRDYIRLYIFRKYIIGDRDMATLNIGFVHSKDDSDFRVAPAFDFEAALDNINLITGLEDDMEFLCREYPGHIKSIMQDFFATDKRKEIRRIITKFSPESSVANSINLVENMLINIRGNYELYKDEDVSCKQIR